MWNILGLGKGIILACSQAVFVCIYKKLQLTVTCVVYCFRVCIMYIGRHIAARKLVLARGKDGDQYTMIQTTEIQTDAVNCIFL